MRRRDFLKSTVLLAAAPTTFPGVWRAHPATAAVRKTEAFDFARLKDQARALAAAPYQPPYHIFPKALADLDYDQYQAIRFRPDRALWAREPLDFRAGFFHRGPMFKEPVRMYEVINRQAQEIAYDPATFDFRKSG
jgi:periplasmic glucans biosynthesis protein